MQIRSVCLTEPVAVHRQTDRQARRRELGLEVTSCRAGQGLILDCTFWHASNLHQTALGVGLACLGLLFNYITTRWINMDGLSKLKFPFEKMRLILPPSPPPPLPLPRVKCTRCILATYTNLIIVPYIKYTLGTSTYICMYFVVII